MFCSMIALSLRIYHSGALDDIMYFMVFLFFIYLRWIFFVFRTTSPIILIVLFVRDRRAFFMHLCWGNLKMVTATLSWELGLC